MGLRIPEDLSVLGFNDEPYSALLSPGLTTVMQPAYQMGQEAARMFLRQLEKPEAPPETRILQTRLVLRESTGKGAAGGYPA
jgi:LacI family transcriptional regulator